METPKPHHRSKTPSFSSSLLDAIYRSIDDSTDNNTTTSMRENKQNTSSSSSSLFSEEVPSLRRAIVIDNWMENRSNSSPCSTPCSRHLYSNSNSNSSDSSCGGVFSSSEAESSSKSISKSSISSMNRSKQPRTSMFVPSERVSKCEQTPNHQGRFTRTTRSRALKLYGDLKCVKQPISPGSRITSFLNSLFSSRTVKRTKLDETMEDSSIMGKSRSVKDSANHSSPVAYFSCLSAKSSSSNRLKRSVKFCPVSSIVDEDCGPCGEKRIYVDDSRLMRNLTNAQRDRFRDYHVKKNSHLSGYDEFREFQLPVNEDDEEVESCCSSDLFELEDIGHYREELPVYGTTDLKQITP